MKIWLKQNIKYLNHALKIFHLFQASPLSPLNPSGSYKFYKYNFITMSNLCGPIKLQPYPGDCEYCIMQTICICFIFFIHQTTSRNNTHSQSRKVTLEA